MRNRAGIILIEDNKLALIERHRRDCITSYSQAAEWTRAKAHEQAAIREAEEELGIVVKFNKKLWKSFKAKTNRSIF